MQDISFQTEPAFKRISAIVEDLIAHNDLYQERLDKQQMINYIFDLFSQADTSPDIDQINQEDLTKRINSILVLHAVAGTLNDLTPEEMAIFDEAVGR
ncbi:hypothetical protein PN465_20120 [Nodularia spumigena CS-584]|jgi:hypothetical protein|uniref:Uncharacterized protein n=1 Tax=Nodularia spumigena UHCC 0060 TaxID=3110300 RepID=A0ABU5UTQ1_NODSP|nr:hypothetical protein [Nodularia spumigena]AHJ29186.1 hypothetical protein NSP_28580 [Nodularia spumigena CCY9414]EAW44526.1 hypothetical protein N9414_15652 [Nodularia spumigena CCY9414]MDB9384501.1 hypothetical protein [Nodularia spumigena CS-584]MEA5525118.1 hypothetical protein [Nodularia spumigena UHCC 0143]MEA5558851.1 hypothetical protein [Nodularia spumigena CH309]